MPSSTALISAKHSPLLQEECPCLDRNVTYSVSAAAAAAAAASDAVTADLYNLAALPSHRYLHIVVKVDGL